MTDRTTVTIGAAAVADCLGARGIAVAVGDDGTRWAFTVPAGDAEQPEPLQVVVAATGTGVVARVRSHRTAAGPDVDRALRLCNTWNRAHPAPRAVLVLADDRSRARVVLDAWLPVGPGTDADLVGRFLDTVVLGAGRFWADPAVTEVLRPEQRPPA